MPERGAHCFADIEPSFPDDTAFLEGWYDTLKNCGFADIFLKTPICVPESPICQAKPLIYVLKSPI